MAVTNYYTVNGSIIGESTNGVRTDYLTDALGSVTGTVNSSAQVINTYRYKPFGDLLSKTGTGADPAFGWVGTQGYKQTQKKFSNFYVRARHYGSSQGRWTTVDPIHSLNVFEYGENNPVSYMDPTGRWTMKNLVASCDPPMPTKIRLHRCGESGFETAYPYSCNPDVNQNGEGASLACSSSRRRPSMTAAWPNLLVEIHQPSVTLCCPSGKRETQRCDYGPFTPQNTRKHPTNDPNATFPQVKCGDIITVSAISPLTKKKCSINVYIIDAGPAPEPRAHADVDLHPTPARIFYTCMYGKAPKSCDTFGLIPNVTVSG